MEQKFRKVHELLTHETVSLTARTRGDVGVPKNENGLSFSLFALSWPCCSTGLTTERGQNTQRRRCVRTLGSNLELFGGLASAYRGTLAPLGITAQW
eukprot:g25992.t1